jgi:hypothetical protein
MAQSLTDRYDERMAGVLSCYDRVVITGTLPTICHSRGMTAFLYTRQIRIFDYPQFAATLRDLVREAAAAIAAEAGPLSEFSSRLWKRLARGHCA